MELHGSTDSDQWSTFRDRLGTNYAPTTIEIAQIKALITADQARWDTLNNQVIELQQQISRILALQRPILQRIDDHKALIHPIRRLPTELLQAIFMSCLPANPIGSMHLEDCPMVLTSVCKSWREVALQSPRLWSTMRIPLSIYPKDARQLSLARTSGIEQWLTRSGSLPLSLTIVEMPRRRGDDEQMADDILPVLFPHADRWESLSFSASWEIISEFIRQHASRYPLLKRVTLRLTYTPQVPLTGSITRQALPTTKLLSSPFLQGPALTEVIFNCLPHGICFTDMQISWETLTTLSVDVNFQRVTPTALLSVLRSTRNLEDLRLSVHVSTEGEPSTNRDESNLIILPKLKRLSVLEARSFPRFGQVIRCPALEYLEYYDAFPTEPNGNINPSITTTEQSALACILSHSGPQLRTLMFDPSVYTMPFIIKLMRQCEELQSLMFVQVDNHYISRESIWTFIDNQFLQAWITPKESSVVPGGTLCPRLTTLAFDHPVGFSLDELKAFLEIKQSGSLEGVAKLETLVVHFPEVGTGEGYSDALRGLFAEPGRVAVKLSPRSHPSTLRDGTETDSKNQWHSFSLGKYFGGSK